jgi:urea transporter
MPEMVVGGVVAIVISPVVEEFLTTTKNPALLLRFVLSNVRVPEAPLYT